MKHFRFFAFVCVILVTALLALGEQYHAAWMFLFAGSALVADWSPARAVCCRQNIIADDLQLTRILDHAIIGFEAALAPLGVFSTAANKDPYTPGNNEGNTITVPVYDRNANEDVRDRTPGVAYSSLVSNTSTGSRTLAINKEKVTGLSFTNEEAQNQVAFDPAMHGLIKGHQLARKVLLDIFSVVRYGRFPLTSLPPMGASSFDTNDVADLGALAMGYDWEQMPDPGLVLNPQFYFNLLKQAPILDAAQSGSTAALRNAQVGNVMGFAVGGTNGLPLNNEPPQTFTAATTDICTAAAHGYLTGDQVQVSSATTLPAGLAAATYYYVHRLSDNTFKLCATRPAALAGSGFVDITDTGTGTHSIRLTNNLVGVAGTKSGIITGFRPVIPTAGIRHKLISFTLVESAKTGLVLEYRHLADEDRSIEYQVIGCHYGKTYGQEDSLMLLSSPAA